MSISNGGTTYVIYKSEIKDAAKKAKLYQWEIALEIGVSEPTLVRWLRTPLPAEKEERILAAIEKLAKEKK